MRLIADSGSSVCDWMLTFEGNEVLQSSTIGFNPFFHSTAFIQETLENTTALLQYRRHIKEIYYYGAGCSSSERQAVVWSALKNVFPNATVSVKHDMLGAAYATLQTTPSIVCILGTGSNSCYFDGKTISEKNFALGHLLGDEGSGAYFGKELMRQYLYKKLPKRIHQLLEEKHGLTEEVIFKNVYNMPNSNVYLASFMKTLSAIKEDEFVQAFVYKGISEFLTHHVWAYREYRAVPTHFIGAIAFHFKALLKDACYKHRIEVGQIIERPILNLTTFHNQDFL